MGEDVLVEVLRRDYFVAGPLNSGLLVVRTALYIEIANTSASEMGEIYVLD